MFITAWLLDMIDSYSIEKLRMYSLVSYFLDLKGHHFCSHDILRPKGYSISIYITKHQSNLSEIISLWPRRWSIGQVI